MVSLGACGRPGPPRPAVTILLSIDTLRPDHLGCYGYGRETSPTVDRIAARGVVFDDVMSPSPWTLPAHGSLLTGLYPSRHGLKSHERYLPAAIPSIASALSAAGFETAAVVNSHNLSPRFGLDRGFQKFRYVEERVDHVGPSQAIFDQALSWIDERSERPLFLFLHSYDVHSDYRSLPEFESAFVRPYDGIADGTTAQMMAFREGKVPLDADDAPHLVDRYDAGIRQMDDELSRFIGELERRGIWSESLFVLTSDHGEEFLEHGDVLHGRTQYQEVLRVPLIVAGPGLPSGTRIEMPVSLIDVMPTLLELLGVEPQDGLDGVSLVSTWGAHGAPVDERLLFGEADHNNDTHDVTRAVKMGRFKLRYDRSTRASALHDLTSDPGELQDASARFPEERDRLLHALEAFMAAPEPETPTITLSPEEIERLRALGYVP